MFAKHYGLLLLLAACCAPLCNAYDYVWRTGRATHYGGLGDPWSIHYGSCQYYYLDRNIGTGWDIAALSDQAYDYKDSCGRCYEVMCENSRVKDGYGANFDRSSVCYDSSSSVVVQITDSCQCEYPPNGYSNKRWCCNDNGYYHLDMSLWAFEKLADPKWGVIGVKYRAVPCDYKPYKAAVAKYPSPGYDVPQNWQSAWDKRPFWSQRQSSSQSSYPSSSASSVPAPALSGSTGYIWSSGTAGNGWSYSYWSSHEWQMWGTFGQKVKCNTVYPFGGITISGPAGQFNGKKVLEFWIKKNSLGTPDVLVQLGADNKGYCRDVPLIKEQQQGWSGDWIKFTLWLPKFSWSLQDAGSFNGCSSSIGAWDVNTIIIKSNRNFNQDVCLDVMSVY